MPAEKHQCSIPDNCPHAGDAADKAVRRVFAIMGVDIDVPSEVERFREDLRFGGRMRRAADHATLAIIGAVVVAGLAALWAGIVGSVGKH